MLHVVVKMLMMIWPLMNRMAGFLGSSSTSIIIIFIIMMGVAPTAVQGWPVVQLLAPRVISTQFQQQQQQQLQLQRRHHNHHHYNRDHRRGSNPFLRCSDNSPRHRQQQPGAETTPTVQPGQGAIPRGLPLLATTNNNTPTPTTITPYYDTKRVQRIIHQHRDTVIVGGGLAGLSTALYLSQMDPDRHITILDREINTNNIRSSSSSSSSSTTGSGTAVASLAAAGMLAPYAERLPSGDLLDLCLDSRRMYPDFVAMVESMAKDSGEEGMAYLWPQQQQQQHEGGSQDHNQKRLEPWSVGYMATGGFLAPAFAGDTVATWAPPSDGSAVQWLDAAQVRELEPNLHPDVVGAWWFPEDASVDARRLTCSLRAACVTAGVHILHGPSYEVTSLDLRDGTCHGVWLQDGRYLAVKSVLVANGAWMRTLLPVPIEPHKGQSLSLRMPNDRPPILRRVLFGQDSYIVPKADGRIVIGATVEPGRYDGHVTPAGLLHMLSYAVQLVPALKDLPVEEVWAGLRPTTPDKGPILGTTPWSNLFLAGGYWRNGVLLAPKTGQLMASLMMMTSSRSSTSTPNIASAGSDEQQQQQQLQLSAQDAHFLKVFAWDRFTSEGSGTALSVQTRYAASMHPLQGRTTGIGVAAAVGTELGSYSTARSAKEERRRDRDALLASSSSSSSSQQKGGGDDASFELAAALGRRDAEAYQYPNLVVAGATTDRGRHEEVVTDALVHAAGPETLPYEGTADAYTVASTTTMSTASPSPASSSSSASASSPSHDALLDVQAAYKTILDNKAKSKVTLPTNDQGEGKRPDPGFRIYHVDRVTREQREVPPYTKPAAFLASIGAARGGGAASQWKSVLPSKPNNNLAEKLTLSDDSASATVAATRPNGDGSPYSETTFDGYQDILAANSRLSRDEELQAMREARQRNRRGVIDDMD